MIHRVSVKYDNSSSRLFLWKMGFPSFRRKRSTKMFTHAFANILFSNKVTSKFYFVFRDQLHVLVWHFEIPGSQDIWKSILGKEQDWTTPWCRTYTSDTPRNLTGILIHVGYTIVTRFKVSKDESRPDELTLKNPGIVVREEHARVCTRDHPVYGCLTSHIGLLFLT